MSNSQPEWSWLPSRIFIDCSYTATSGRNSGIERVVRSLQREMSSQVARYNQAFTLHTAAKQPLNSSGNTTTAVDSQSTLQNVIAVGGDFAALGPREERWLNGPASFRANVLRCLPTFYRSCATALCNTTQSARLKKWLLPQAGHLGAFKLPHNIMDRATRKMIRLFGHTIRPGHGDLLFLPDAYWGKNSVWQAAAKARARDAKVAIVVYDLIPLTHKEFVGERRHENFKKYLQAVVQHADLILAISDTVRNQVEDLLPEYGRNVDHPVTCRSFTLGAEFRDDDGPIRGEVQQLFGPQLENNPFLMVATFDPRKNHEFLLNAFDKLWARGSTEKLCFIGRVGSLCEPLMQRIEAHPEKNKKLFVYHDISDSELQHCYRHAKGVVFPSVVEGFGLPIVESLRHGRRTMVSDTPIHREVGGNLCEYFTLASTEPLAELIASPPTFDRFRLEDGAAAISIPTWQQAACQVLTHCVDLFETPQNHSLLSHSKKRRAA